ncbi:MAG TPA: response regulator [Tepidisphaeraceae bacterium]|jgi:signal transduction histidine kinase/DNA-binding response OmpR family regulator
MSDPNGQASILIVDDKPDKLLALEAVLEDLGQRIVRANSGREALRHLLAEEFAVILLDVNMPDIDGFEAASMIRQRSSSQHIPIIFITAFGDEMHMARGYSLGAVDFIQAPVIPEILRSKVSVFVDLYQKTAQVRRQSETLRRRATQLQKLAAASMSINSAVAIDQMLKSVTGSARDVIGSHLCLAMLWADPLATKRGGRIRSAASFSDKYRNWRDRELNLEALSSTVIAQTPSATRLSDGELREHPDWETIRHLASPAIRGGLLSAPLTDSAGKNLGVILIFDCDSAQFTSDDEALAMQLAQITSIAIQNAIFAQEREANRLKDEFLATLSHELRTPLSAIVGWTQLLRLEKLPPDAQHGLDVIERNVKAQTRLIEDLLDVSRITTGKMRLNLQNITLAPIINATLEAIRPAAEAKGIDLAFDCARDVRTAADPDRLQQVVWNLLSNAVKFTPARGRVIVTLDDFNSQARIRVSDTGNGIEPEFLGFVFDRFRQADSTTTRSHGGLGLGLTIVRHIVELHGGTVAAQSSGIGKGALFTVTLPVSLPPITAALPRGTHTSAVVNPNRHDHSPSLGGKRVLLVDDEKDARELVREILHRSHAQVTAAASVREAREFFAAGIPDVLVCDLALPEEDGYSFIRTLRQLPPDHGGQTPAIALTAYARDEDRLRALTAGFQIHLTKPVEAKQLLDAIAHLTRSNNDNHDDSDQDPSARTEKYPPVSQNADRPQ